MVLTKCTLLQDSSSSLPWSGYADPSVLSNMNAWLWLSRFGDSKSKSQDLCRSRALLPVLPILKRYQRAETGFVQFRITSRTRLRRWRHLKFIVDRENDKLTQNIVAHIPKYNSIFLPSKMLGKVIMIKWLRKKYEKTEKRENKTTLVPKVVFKTSNLKMQRCQISLCVEQNKIPKLF